MFRNPYADGLIVLVIVLLFVGPKRLPMFGRSLGQGLREFKDSITGQSNDDQAERPALGPAETSAAVSASERQSAEVGPEPRA